MVAERFMDSILKISRNSIYNSYYKKYNKIEKKSRVAEKTVCQIEVFREQLITNQLIEDLEFTTEVFDNRGLFFVSKINKLVIVLVKNINPANEQFKKKCVKYSHKYFIHYMDNKDLSVLKEQISVYIQQFSAWLVARAGELNEEKVKSEEWFKEKFKKEPFYKILGIEYNKPIRKFIYDAFSSKYNLVLEIDGSVHDTPEQIEKDVKRDRLTGCYGYRTIRIKAFNNDSYDAAVRQIKKKIKKIPKSTGRHYNKVVHPKKKLGKVILRKSDTT